MRQVWDTQGFVEGLKSKGQYFIAAFFAGEVVLAAPTILELAVWDEEDPVIRKLYEQLHRVGDILAPKRRDYYRAGRWLQNLKITGSHGERRKRRAKLAMDSLIAATAWGAGLPVVTGNHKDFAHLKAAAEGMLPGKLKPEVVPIQDAL